jgi:hypothetical protein
MVSIVMEMDVEMDKDGASITMSSEASFKRKRLEFVVTKSHPKPLKQGRCHASRLATQKTRQPGKGWLRCWHSTQRHYIRRLYKRMWMTTG